MADVQLVRCRAEDQVGYPAYFRATLTQPWYVPDWMWPSEVEAVRANILNDTWGGWINPDPAVGGVEAVVMDLNIAPVAKARTVADLVSALNYLPGAALVKLERVTRDDAYGASAADDRAQATEDADTEAQSSGPLATVATAASATVSAVKWIGLAVALVALLYLAHQGDSIARTIRGQ